MKSSRTYCKLNWPKPRIEIEGMDSYNAPLEGRRNLLRLDFNENTLGPSPKVIEALHQIASADISIYPEYNGLKEALINNLNLQHPTLNIKQDQIGIFNGVDAAINAIFHSYGEKGDMLLTTKPTFGYYTPCAQMQGMRTIEIPYLSNNFNYPIDEISSILIAKKPKIFIICNPNNPTGSLISAQKIMSLALSSPETLIVVDEVYEAFGGDSLLPITNFNKTENLIVLRSLSKTAGLAGLRVGFAFGNKNIINSIKRVLGPYDVNSFAVTAALAALNDQGYIDSYVQEIRKAREWITKKLESSKIKFHINGGNYLLIWPTRKTQKILFNLKEEGILVRDMSNKCLLENSFRVSIGTREQMQIFWESFIKYESL